MYDVIIVGAGTAGLTAAIYARRAEKTVLLIEARSYGGQIINTPDIENYPVEAHISGFEFAQKLYAQATGLGAELVSDRAVGVEAGQDGAFTVKTLKGEYACRAVILATGSENRKLGLEGEDALVGRGISYCATCDGNFFRGKTVAVNGGGNTALEDALYLSDIASKVYLIHRRDGFRGEETTVGRLRKKDNVEFILNSRVTGLVADRRLRAIEITNNDGEKTTLEVNGLFVAVGRIPENGDFAGLIDLDPAGYAVSGENCRTKTPGIFVAGDNRAKEVRQLVTAAADGAVAATEAVRYIAASEEV
ncbi:MAG: FAD-dependent oxidoreductase [Clostridia bacterium]|nr:FAD-dependent oxidoreductase [Clostridia bacterium]